MIHILFALVLTAPAAVIAVQGPNVHFDLTINDSPALDASSFKRALHQIEPTLKTQPTPVRRLSKRWRFETHQLAVKIAQNVVPMLRAQGHELVAGQPAVSYVFEDLASEKLPHGLNSVDWSGFEGGVTQAFVTGFLSAVSGAITRPRFAPEQLVRQAVGRLTLSFRTKDAGVVRVIALTRLEDIYAPFVMDRTMGRKRYGVAQRVRLIASIKGEGLLNFGPISEITLLDEVALVHHDTKKFMPHTFALLRNDALREGRWYMFVVDAVEDINRWFPQLGHLGFGGVYVPLLSKPGWIRKIFYSPDSFFIKH